MAANRKKVQSNMRKTYVDQCDDRVVQYLLQHENMKLTADKITKAIPDIDKASVNRTLYFIRDHCTTLATHVLRQTPDRKPTFILMSKSTDYVKYLADLTYKQLCRSTGTRLAIGELFDLVMQLHGMSNETQEMVDAVNAFLDSIGTSPSAFWEKIHPTLIKSLAISERLSIFNDGRVSIEYDTTRNILLVDSDSIIDGIPEDQCKLLIEFGWIICFMDHTNSRPPGEDFKKDIIHCITKAIHTKEIQRVAFHPCMGNEIVIAYVLGEINTAFPLYNIILYTESYTLRKIFETTLEVLGMDKKLKVTDLVPIPLHIKSDFK